MSLLPPPPGPGVVGGAVVGGAVVGGGVVGLPVVGGAVVGGAVVGGGGALPPLHGAPLILQLVGTPAPLVLKPNDVVPPGATLPLYSRFFATTCWPEVLIRASQYAPIAVPEGRSNSTVQDVI